MSDSRPSLYKLFTWVFLAGLIGVYALYDWYVGTLNQTLSEQGTLISETAARLTDTEQRLQGLTESEQGLRTALATAETGLQSSTERLDAATAQVAALTQELEQHREALAAAAEREKHLQAHIESTGAEHEGARKELIARVETIHKARAELELAHQGSQKRVDELQAEIGALHQRLADADAAYAVKAKEQEARLTERVTAYRVALQGSEPERAALVTRLEEQASVAHSALEQAQERHAAELAQAAQERQAAQTQAATRLAEVQQQADEQAQARAAAQEAKAAQDEALAEARGKVMALTEEAQSERDSLAALEQKYQQSLGEWRAELDQAGQTLAAVQEQLSTAVAAATQEKATLDGQLKTAEQRIGELEQALKDAQSSTQETLAQAQAQAQQQAEAALAAERDKAAQALVEEREARAAALTQTRGLIGRYTELKARQTDRGMLVSLTDEQLHFPTGGTALPKGPLPSLDRIAALLAEHPQVSARIEGYTDSSGADQTNLTLSKARAEAVLAALIERGVPAGRLGAEGFGKQQPIADNATAAGRRKNRRVEVYLLEPAP